MIRSDRVVKKCLAERNRTGFIVALGAREREVSAGVSTVVLSCTAGSKQHVGQLQPHLLFPKLLLLCCVAWGYVTAPQLKQPAG